jgi:hypothetical protein
VYKSQIANILSTLQSCREGMRVHDAAPPLQAYPPHVLPYPVAAWGAELQVSSARSRVRRVRAHAARFIVFALCRSSTTRCLSFSVCPCWCVSVSDRPAATAPRLQRGTHAGASCVRFVDQTIAESTARARARFFIARLRFCQAFPCHPFIK